MGCSHVAVDCEKKHIFTWTPCITPLGYHIIQETGDTSLQTAPDHNPIDVGVGITSFEFPGGPPTIIHKTMVWITSFGCRRSPDHHPRDGCRQPAATSEAQQGGRRREEGGRPSWARGKLQTGGWTDIWIKSLIGWADLIFCREAISSEYFALFCSIPYARLFVCTFGRP